MKILKSSIKRDQNENYTLTLKCENTDLVFFKTKDGWQMRASNQGICIFFDKTVVTCDRCIKLFLKNQLVGMVDISDNDDNTIKDVNAGFIIIGVYSG